MDNQPNPKSEALLKATAELKDSLSALGGHTFLRDLNHATYIKFMQAKWFAWTCFVVVMLVYLPWVVFPFILNALQIIFRN